MDGVTILNEFEVVQVVNDTFNPTAGVIALLVTVLICAIAGFFIGRINRDEVLSTLVGALFGFVLGFLSMSLFGTIFSYPAVTETTMQYEVILDDSVSMNEFCEHYNVVEQRGDIFVVEEKE